MPPPEPKLLLEVVAHEEYYVLGEHFLPVEGTAVAYIHLRLPSGEVIMAEIPHAKLRLILNAMP